jgi:nitrate/nitrite transporter NarK
VSGISMAQAVPINADKVFPPTTDQGWAMGLEGTPNTSTALAPMGAMSQVVAAGLSHWLNKPVNRMPSAAPATIRHRSTVGIVRDAGEKRRSQASKGLANGCVVFIMAYLPGSTRLAQSVIRHAKRRPIYLVLPPPSFKKSPSLPSDSMPLCA